MRIPILRPLLLVAAAASATPSEPLDNPQLLSEAASLVSEYVPQSAYTQLTASVAAAASAASVTGDPGSLFLSAILATAPPAWFYSAVPPYFSSNIGALEAAVSTLRNGAPPQPTATSSSETLVETRTTNSRGSTVTTSYTSTLPTSTSGVPPSSSNAAASAAGVQRDTGLGAVALALGWTVFL